VVNGYGNFAIGLDPKFFHKLHIQSASEKLKIIHSDTHIRNRPLSCTLAKIFGNDYLLHEAKVVDILPSFKNLIGWSGRWSCDKYDTHKKTRVSKGLGLELGLVFRLRKGARSH